MTMVFLIIKFLKYLGVMEDTNIILLSLYTLPLVIREFIVVVKTLEVGLGLKRTATIYITIV